MTTTAKRKRDFLLDEDRSILYIHGLENSVPESDDKVLYQIEDNILHYVDGLSDWDKVDEEEPDMPYIRLYLNLLYDQDEVFNELRERLEEHFAIQRAKSNQVDQKPTRTT